MVTQAPEATTFIPPAALPPKALISPNLEAVASMLGEATDWTDRQVETPLGVTVLRLLCPFGDPTGLALPALSQPVPLVCQLAALFARQANQLDEIPFMDTLGAKLHSDAVRQTFPELFQRPGPNANILWSTHAQLASAPAYSLLAVDLQFGLIAALARTGWVWTLAAAKSMDAMITAALRIVPQLDPEALAQPLAALDPSACGKVIQRAAFNLTYLRHPDRLLPRATQLGYLRDCCRLLNHPEWASTEMGDTPLGASATVNRVQRTRSWQFDDDDPPETEAAPDRFRERHLEKLEREVRRQVTPGASLDEFDADADLGVSGLLIYGEELAVLREYPNPLAWHAAHPNDLAVLIGMIFRGTTLSGSFAIAKLSTEKLMLRTTLSTICLTGRTLDWLLRVRVGEWPDPTVSLPSMPPRYVSEYDAIVYWPEAIPDLPTQPEQTADLFEPISPAWVLPLPEPLIPWWRELAKRRQQGEQALALTVDQVENALKSATNILREKAPNLPALTQGRLRAAYTALMECEGQLGPLLAACISGQWRTSLRVPLFYTTLSLPLLAAYFRTGKPPPEERVFAIDPKALNRELRLLLIEVCQVANVPILLPSQLIHFVRLDLRQFLPNLNLAVLMGLVKFTPVAADQVSDVLHELGITPSEWAKNLPEWFGSSETSSVCDEMLLAEAELEQTGQPDDEDSLLTTYDQLLDEIRPHVRALCQPKPPKRSRDFLEKWARSTPPADQAQQDVARFNLAWLARWLLSMTKDRRLKPGSRAVYWSAILQLIRIAPACGLHELNQRALPEMMEQGYGMSRVTRVAWLRLCRFLKQAGLPIQEVVQRQRKAPTAWKPAYALLESHQKSLLVTLRGTPLGRACYIAQQAGLRVSEVCQLHSKDLVLDGQPYLIIRRSKRGRNRRVGLAHLPPAHLDRQRQHQVGRLGEGIPTYLVDAQSQPLIPKTISEGMRKALEATELQDTLRSSHDLRFHSWRAAAAEAFYKKSGDIRYVAAQMGHALAATTVGSYLHTLDLQSASLLQSWTSPLYCPDLHLPVLVLAGLLGRTGRRVVQMIKEFNATNASWTISLVGSDNLPDGLRPVRPGRPADYLRVALTPYG